jgi:HAD superfamily hydrolase (TIGR01549 family)
MDISAIIYDLVGPLLIRNPQVILDIQVQEINKHCANTTNETLFWRKIASEYNYSTQKIETIKDAIAGAYLKNEPMWNFHQTNKTRYKTAILNNGTFGIFQKWKKQFQLADEFNYLFNSANIGLKKPDPKIFLHCLEKLTVSPKQCIFIDDNEVNIQAAKLLGIQAILYSPNNHANFLDQINRII